MKLTVTHTLLFSVGTPARAVQHVLLSASNTAQQRVERWSIDMPGLAEGASFRDGFGNHAHLVSQVRPEGEIAVTVSGAVETIDKAGVLGRVHFEPPAALFVRPTGLTQPDADLLDGLTAEDGRIAFYHALMGRVHERAASGTLAPTLAAEQSQEQSEDGQSQMQSLDEPAEVTASACTHAFIGAARALDMPARYVTGYLYGDDGSAATHAWAEAWDDRLGWIGFDPLLNLCPTIHHIRLASGLDALATRGIRSVPEFLAPPVETVTIEAG